MPRLSVLMIRASLLYLGAAAFSRARSCWRIAAYRSARGCIACVRCTSSFCFWAGRCSSRSAWRSGSCRAFRSGRERGREELAWVAFALLNAGVLGTAIGGAIAAPAVVALLGRSAEGLAAAAFALHAWPRVKVFGEG